MENNETVNAPLINGELRILSQVIYTLTIDLKVGTNGSPELTKADNELKLAKAYCGKLLGLFGEPTPYQNDGKRVEIKDIEKEANTDKVYLGDLGIFNDSDTLITKVDKCREYIELILDRFYYIMFDKNIIRNYNVDGNMIAVNTYYHKHSIYTNNVVSHLTNAKIWLGFELGRIRNLPTAN
jgi:hypothetical protein